MKSSLDLIYVRARVLRAALIEYRQRAQTAFIATRSAYLCILFTLFCVKFLLVKLQSRIIYLTRQRVSFLKLVYLNQRLHYADISFVKIYTSCT